MFLRLSSLLLEALPLCPHRTMWLALRIQEIIPKASYIGAYWACSRKHSNFSETQVASQKEAGIHTRWTLDEFTLFPKLPIELRLKIWNEALPGPRVVEILWSPTHGLCTNFNILL
ncbi:hypothetical protein BDZ45DRAFT_741750 [Acephala macrosclerotiorum]|nr:hypothetical protein BDZ45DRAFT_741750 [Acephala macrosclerotiorum]